MALVKSVGDFFALDVGTNAIRVVQLKRTLNSWTLEHYGYAPIDSKLTSSDSEESKRKVAEVIMTAVGQSGIKAKNVVIGLPSSKTFTTVIDVPIAKENTYHDVDQWRNPWICQKIIGLILVVQARWLEENLADPLVLALG